MQSQPQGKLQLQGDSVNGGVVDLRVRARRVCRSRLGGGGGGCEGEYKGGGGVEGL